MDQPFNPVSLALGAEASFVARTLDSDRAHLVEVLSAAATHRGTSLVEIYQNCPIFNDGAFQMIKDRDAGKARIAYLRDGEPIRVGEEHVVVRDGAAMAVVPAAEVGEQEVVTHDVAAADPSQAFALSRLDDPSMAHVPMGIFRQVDRASYDDQVRAQVDGARASAGGTPSDEDLQNLLFGKDTWTVSP